MTKYFHFLDKATGEYFVVANDNLRDATANANGWFEDPVFCGMLDEEEVDMLGEDVW